MSCQQTSTRPKQNDLMWKHGNAIKNKNNGKTICISKDLQKKNKKPMWVKIYSYQEDVCTLL